MKQVSPLDLSRNDKLNFIVAYTLRNERVSISSFGTNYVIDIDGTIYELSKPSNRSATITIIGGSSSFAHAKVQSAPLFYLTTNQRRTLRNTMHFVSQNSSAEITSNHWSLEEKLNGQYYNSRG